MRVPRLAASANSVAGIVIVISNKIMRLLHSSSPKSAAGEGDTTTQPHHATRIWIMKKMMSRIPSCRPVFRRPVPTTRTSTSMLQTTDTMWDSCFFLASGTGHHLLFFFCILCVLYFTGVPFIFNSQTAKIVLFVKMLRLEFFLPLDKFGLCKGL